MVMLNLIAVAVMLLFAAGTYWWSMRYGSGWDDGDDGDDAPGQPWSPRPRTGRQIIRPHGRPARRPALRPARARTRV